jgi:integrase/recombinase XerD
MKEFTLRGCAVKVVGNGRAKILTPAEIDRLFDRGFITARDRLFFAVTFYCACRISEALALTTYDIVGGSVTLPKATTKGLSATRTLRLHQLLAKYLKAYNPDVGFLFPRRDNTKPLTRALLQI